MTKEELFNEGIKYINEFCKLNNITKPTILQKSNLSCSGYYNYRNNIIYIDVKNCSNEVINPIRSWSHRHYFVDREPCGVLCHEFGHYLHKILTNNRLILPKENPITNYEPDYYERFAETIKLFILNPDLLKNYAPERYDALIKLGIKPIISTNWKDTFGKNINPKFINACQNRINKSKKETHNAIQGTFSF